MIYLDYAASSVPFPEVISHVGRISGEVFGNPGAIHSAGAEARSILQSSRLLLAKLIKVRPEELYFTSGGTESNNWAVQAACAVPGKRHIVCSATEHSSILAALSFLEQKGYNVTYLRPDRSGILSPEAAEAAIRTDTALLCVQAVNNETGVMQDVDAMAALARAHRVPLFCDGVQSFGHVSQNLHKAQFLSLSAHKLGGPRGVGCLVVRQPLDPMPMIHGGGQEFGHRSGTENLPGIAGFALAARLSCENLKQEQARLEALRNQLEQGLSSLYPDLEIAGKDSPRSSILCCRIPGISAEEMVTRLDLSGICASPGAACAARSGGPSHVLLAMGYTPKEATEFVRFSPGRHTTPEEIRQTIHAINRICEKRRQIP